jgi:integrase
MTQSLTLGLLVELFKGQPRWRQNKGSSRSRSEADFRHIIGRLGANRGATSIARGDAEHLSASLRAAKPSGAGLSCATANRVVASASMLFRFAIRSRLVNVNPFDAVERCPIATTQRAFVDAETSKAVLDAMPCNQWRLLFAFARWGGLRTPSESRLLRWRDIDWDRKRFTARSPKFDRDGGRETRVVPLFPELEPLLAERFIESEPVALVLPMLQTLNRSSCRCVLDRTLRGLGLTRWPQPFHNLRLTRQVELEKRFPRRVVCAWLGISEPVSHRHSARVAEEHFVAANRPVPTELTADLNRPSASA